MGAAAAAGVCWLSKASAGAAMRIAVATEPKRMASDIRIGFLFRLAAGMRDGAVDRGANLLRVFPEIAGGETVIARLPVFFAAREFVGGKLHVERALLGIEHDDVAILHEPDRAADRRFRPDMADAETAGRAGEAAVSNQRDLAAHPLTVEGRRGREHFAHAGPAFRALVADHEHVAFLVFAILHRLEAGFLAVEAARGAGEFQPAHAGDLHDRA